MLTLGEAAHGLEPRTAMWPLSAAWDTMEPGPPASAESPLAVTRLSCRSVAVVPSDRHVLTARELPEPTRPSIQPSVVWVGSSTPWRYTLMTCRAEPPIDARYSFSPSSVLPNCSSLIHATRLPAIASWDAFTECVALLYLP